MPRPDGSVFVADWYDAGVGGHAFSDQTTGRIYRVVPKGHKTEKVKVDFGTVPGLIAALKSPNIATQDAARRGLIARGKELNVTGTVGELAVHDPDPIYRARALWVWHAIEGDTVAMAALTEVVNQGDARIREQAVRILGRDCRENGHVEYKNPEAKQPPAALKHLELFLALVDDPDAGVRREVILALRNLPTDKVGDALRKLAASWDGQDRWYLEALGLALDNRENDYLSKLFDGSLYGDLGDLEVVGRNGNVALPPYFPVDRNEAFIAVGTPDLPVNALSKNLGLAWRVHKRAVLPVLERIAPHLRSPELQQAVDDILERMSEPETAELVADMAAQTPDPVHRRELLTIAGESAVGELELRTHKTEGFPGHRASSPEPREPAAGDRAGGRDARWPVPRDSRSTGRGCQGRRGSTSRRRGGDRLVPDHTQPGLDQLIASVRGKPNSNSVAEAAVRANSRLFDARDDLTKLLTAGDYPLGLRREALRTLMQQHDGGNRVLALARAKELPDDLKTEATTLLHTIADRRCATRRTASCLYPRRPAAGGCRRSAS